MNKQNVAYLYNAVLFDNYTYNIDKPENIMLSEKRQI